MGQYGWQAAIGQATPTSFCCTDNHGSTHNVHYHGTHGTNKVTNWEHNTRAHKLATNDTLMLAVWHANILTQGYRFSSKPVQVHSMTTLISVGDQRQQQAAPLGPTEITASAYSNYLRSHQFKSSATHVRVFLAPLHAASRSAARF